MIMQVCDFTSQHVELHVDAETCQFLVGHHHEAIKEVIKYVQAQI